MPLLRRRGFTLIELMVALVLLGIVAGGIYKVLVTNQQTYLAQTQRIDLQQNLRAGVTILPADQAEEIVHPPVRNVVGLLVGEMRPAKSWLG